jgi:hypothetical protein
MAFAQGFYVDQTITALTASYQYFNFGGTMYEAVISNDDASGSNNVVFSWDGTNTHGIVRPTETLGVSRIDKNGVYVKYATGAPAYRIFASSPQ